MLLLIVDAAGIGAVAVRAALVAVGSGDEVPPVADEAGIFEKPGLAFIFAC